MSQLNCCTSKKIKSGRLVDIRVTRAASILGVLDHFGAGFASEPDFALDLHVGRGSAIIRMMLSIHVQIYLAFVLATCILMLIPGPNVALIVANSVAYGTCYGLVTMAGTSSAMIVQLFN